MDINNTSTLFVGIILMNLGGIIITMVVLLFNSLFNKYWKPVEISTYQIPEYNSIENMATANTKAEANTIIKAIK